MDKILGVKIDNLGEKEILKKIESFLDEPKFHQIATVNPEFILEAQKNGEFRRILNDCSLRVVDGFGITCVFLKKFQKVKCRMTGVFLAEKVLEMAEKRGLGVFLACRKDGLSSFEEVKKALLKKYPKLILDGENINIDKKYYVPNTMCQILLCNFGSPEQEFFIKNQKSGIIRLGIGVGGSFDFWTGKIKRAPGFMRKIGLEWLWRLLMQPRRRIRKIFRSVIVFPIKVIFNK